MSPGDSNTIKPGDFEHVAGTCIENGDFDMSESMTQLLARLAEVTEERDRLAAELQKLREQEPVWSGWGVWFKGGDGMFPSHFLRDNYGIPLRFAGRFDAVEKIKRYTKSSRDMYEPREYSLYAAPVPTPAVPVGASLATPEAIARAAKWYSPVPSVRDCTTCRLADDAYPGEHPCVACGPAGDMTGDYKHWQPDAVPAPSVPEEWLKCWLIERPAFSEWPAIWLTITTDGRRCVSDGGTMYATGGDWYFTSAAREALKFADKESADEYVRHNKIKDVVVTEHIFDNRALLQSADHSEKSLEMVTPEFRTIAKDSGV